MSPFHFSNRDWFFLIFCSQGHPVLAPVDHLSLTSLFSADFAEVDILEEEDVSDHGSERYNLEWMVKVVYTIKPALEAPTQ